MNRILFRLKLPMRNHLTIILVPKTFSYVNINLICVGTKMRSKHSQKSSRNFHRHWWFLSSDQKFLSHTFNFGMLYVKNDDQKSESFKNRFFFKISGRLFVRLVLLVSFECEKVHAMKLYLAVFSNCDWVRIWSLTVKSSARAVTDKC